MQIACAGSIITDWVLNFIFNDHRLLALRSYGCGLYAIRALECADVEAFLHAAELYFSRRVKTKMCSNMSAPSGARFQGLVLSTKINASLT